MSFGFMMIFSPQMKCIRVTYVEQSKAEKCTFERSVHVIRLYQNKFNIEFSITENRCAYLPPHTVFRSSSRSFTWFFESLCANEVHGHAKPMCE